jgi:hypothetical protein
MARTRALHTRSENESPQCAPGSELHALAAVYEPLVELQIADTTHDCHPA